jgi:predicted RecB family nuclease
MIITASRLYDYIICPHKVWRDIHGPQKERIVETNPFVELLWQRGLQHEERIAGTLGSFLHISEGTLEGRYEKTLEATKHGTPLIYQGVLKHDNLLGIPDLLRLSEDHSYMPIDIKSGMGLEGADEESGEGGKPKKHYAVQLCLYNELLKKHGLASHNSGKILDINSEEVDYDLRAPMGVRNKTTWWDFYEAVKKDVALLVGNEVQNKPALSGTCKLCWWHNSCKKWCEEKRDLTNIFYLGRSVRDTINKDLSIESADDFLRLNVKEVIQEKKKDKDFLRGVGETLLTKFINRANILYLTKKPVIYEEITFPKVTYELFFDIEDDPTQEYVYLHGIYERKGDNEQYIHFLAHEVDEDAERKAWRDFWEYINSLPTNDYAIYYYSHHERITYKKLQKRHPGVIATEEVEEFFDNPNVIDLYKIVQSKSDWPVGSYSLKTLATYLGFDWRDKTPSGTLSIQWFNEYLEKKDHALMQRILEYNEDDCKATMILKDTIEKLKYS